MKYLFIDSATTNLIVAIVLEGKIAYIYNKNDGKDTSSKIMPILDNAFKQTNLKPKDINKIFVTTGPGSFTGIRVGLTLAKTYAYALNIPVIPLSSLEVIASGKGTALIDARRGYVFAGSYDENLNNIYEDTYTLYKDDFIKPYISYDFENCLKPNIDVLKIIKKHENDTPINPHKLNPNYLKRTEAEENHDRRS